MLEEGLLEKTGRALSDRYRERTKAMRCLCLLTCAISLACVEETCQGKWPSLSFPLLIPGKVHHLLLMRKAIQSPVDSGLPLIKLAAYPDCTPP